MDDDQPPPFAGATRRYDATGTLTVARTGRILPTSGVVTMTFDATGRAFTGDLLLRPSVSAAVVLGRRLASSATQIAQAAPFSGRIAGDGTVTVAATLEATILSVRLFGIRLLGGSACRTAGAATVPFVSRPGFGIDDGGTLTATYTRPAFEGCGVLTPVVNAVLAGPGNDATITLTPVPA